MSTMRDVAAKAGVSPKTVSRVFNNELHVTDETRSRVQAAMSELQYVPNLVARTFRSGKDAALGVAIPDISDPFFAAVTRSIEAVAASRGHAVVVTSLGNDPERERASVEALLHRQIVGLIATPTSDDQSYLASWAEKSPVVFIDRTPKQLSADSFVEDDQGASRMATEHLIRAGHRRILMVGDTLDIPTTRNRLRGFREAMTAAQLTVPDDHLMLGVSPDPSLLTRLIAALGQASGPTAIFSSNARTSIPLLTAMRAVNDTTTAFVSFGDLDLGAALNPGLTVMDQNPQALGQQAAQRLFDKLAQPARRFRRKTLLPIRLVERGSGELTPRQ